MRAVLIEEPSEINVGELSDPKADAGEVLISVALTGICGTDLHILDGDFEATRYPIVPGHEVTGTVLAQGLGVESPVPGERVVIDPGIPCQQCALCGRGRPNLCERRQAIGITRFGGAAEHLTAPAVNCHVLDEGVTDAAAVLSEPLACVLHAFDMVPSPLAHKVLIFGAGPIGLLATQVAVHLGCNVVDVVDTNRGRLSVAQRAGARAAGLPGELLGDRAEWDLVIDASGAAAAITDGLSRVERGGTFLQIGVAPAEAVVPLSPYQVFAREISVVGSMTTCHTFPAALRLLAGVIDTELIVENPLPLSRYVQAVDRVREGRSLKVVVRPDY